jgi:Arabinose efflux permease
VFSSSLFFRAVDPIIPQIAADLSQPVETVALLATAFALPYALMQPVLGAMGDVLGKTRTMFACLVVVTVSTFAGAFAWNLSVLMASRIVSGIVAGGIFPVPWRWSHRWFRSEGDKSRSAAFSPERCWATFWARPHRASSPTSPVGAQYSCSTDALRPSP